VELYATVEGKKCQKVMMYSGYVDLLRTIRNSTLIDIY